jgi:hypothetical protein
LKARTGVFRVTKSLYGVLSNKKNTIKTSPTIVKESGRAIYASDAERWQAVVQGNRNADGEFCYSVKATGVYSAPLAPGVWRVASVTFHKSPENAERVGFRACKRCKPKGPAKQSLETLLYLERIPSDFCRRGFAPICANTSVMATIRLAFLYSHCFGARLNGTGENPPGQITLLAALKKRIVPGQTPSTPHLLVLPATPVFNWHIEIERFAPFLRIRESRVR